MQIDIDNYYRTYGPMVMRRCRAILRDEDAAADAMQDTFVRLLRYQGTLADRAPSSLLYTIATNVCLNQRRSAGRRPSVPAGMAIDYLATTEDHADRIATGHFVDRVLGKHQRSTRRIVDAYYRDGRTLSETAQIVGLSVSGVRKRLQRVREDASGLSVA